MGETDWRPNPTEREMTAEESIVGEIEVAVENACYPKGRAFDPVFIEVTPRQIAEAAWGVIEPHYRHALDAQLNAEIHEREHREFAQDAHRQAIEDAAQEAEYWCDGTREEKFARIWAYDANVADKIRALHKEEE